MIQSPTPFPCSGSKAFEQATGRPLTILRNNLDGTMFCRRDDEKCPPSWNRSGRASGNVTLEEHEVVETREETALGILARKAANRESRKAKRPPTPKRHRAKAGAA